MQHYGLVCTIAKRYIPLCDNASDMDDLMQAGFIGLMRAEGTYQPDKGKFSSWATFYIKKELQTALGLNVPRLRAQREAVSLDAPIGEDEACCMGDILPDPSTDIEPKIEQTELQAAVRERVDAIEDQEAREVVRLAYLEEKGLTIAAEEMGLSYKSAKNARIRAFTALRKDPSIKALAEAHGLDRCTDWHYHRGLNAWRSDWMSTTETLAFWRIEQESGGRSISMTPFETGSCMPRRG